MKQVAVAGGGISGLAIAFELLERGVPRDAIVLLEAKDRPGGNIRTDRTGGCTIEWGVNGFLDNSPPTLDLVRRLDMRERLLPSRAAAARRFLYRKGALHPVPAGPVAMLRTPLLSSVGKLRILGEPFLPKGGGEGESVFDFAARRIGKEAARVFVDAMVSGVFAGDARRLELAAAFPRMAELERRYGSLVKALFSIARARRKARREGAGGGGSGGGPAGPGGRLTSFREGMEELTRALARRLGPSLRTGAAVTAVTAAGDTYTITVEGAAAIEARAVVLAMPSSLAARALRRLDGELAATLGAIPSAPVAVVATAYRKEDLAAEPVGFGFLVPRGERLRILGCLWTSSIWEGRVGDDSVLLRTMIGGARDPDAIALHDDALLETVARDLEKAMGIGARPIFHRIYRHRLGIPQYEGRHTARLREIAGRLEAHPGLFVAGNSYGGISVNHCVAEASEIAGALLPILER